MYEQEVKPIELTESELDILEPIILDVQDKVEE